jgi:hypothetical protein
MTSEPKEPKAPKPAPVGMTGEDKTPWEKKTDEEKAKSVCDHLVQEQLSGNLRPVSEDETAKPHKPKASEGAQWPTNP